MKIIGNFWGRWVLHYSVGEVLAIGVASLMARFVFVGFFESAFSTSLIMLVILVSAGLIEGLMTGYVQWRSFSRLFLQFKPLPWILVTVAFTIGAWLFFLPPAVIIISMVSELQLVNTHPFLYTVLVGMGFGAFISLPQVFILKKFYRDSLYWVSGNIIGWMFSFLILYSAIAFQKTMESDVLRVIVIALACVLSGFIQGLVTGLSLHYLMIRKADIVLV
jgi:hypothetical protein